MIVYSYGDIHGMYGYMKKAYERILNAHEQMHKDEKCIHVFLGDILIVVQEAKMG